MENINHGKCNQPDIFEGPQPNNQIWYTSIDENLVSPLTYVNCPKVISNVYENGKGIMTFDQDLQGVVTFCSENLSSISFPQAYDFSSYVKDGCYLFFPCPNLKRIKYSGGDGINLIWNDVLINVANHNLKEYEIPSNLKVKRDVFIGKPDSLDTIIVGKSTTLSEGAFTGLKSLKKIIGEKSTKSHKCWYEDNTLIAYACGCGDTDCNIKEGTTKIGREVFIGSRLKTIKIPKTVKKIGWRAFDGLNNVIMRGPNVSADSQYLIVDNEVLIHFVNPTMSFCHKMIVPDNVKAFKSQDKPLYYSTYEFPESLELLDVEIDSLNTLIFRGETPPIHINLWIDHNIIRRWEETKRKCKRYPEINTHSGDRLPGNDTLNIQTENVRDPSDCIKIIVPAVSLNRYKREFHPIIERYEDFIIFKTLEELTE